MDAKQKFAELLNVYWLRPESAVWRALDIVAMEGFEFRSPSLDLGCGDGIFSFIRAGGRLSEKYDLYRTLQNLDKFFDNIDIYDQYDPSSQIVVAKNADYQIDYAFDHKKSLLDKAEKLDFYKEYIVGDANDALPFPDNSIQTVFSNVIYWLDDPARVFSEIFRILKPGGQCCVMLLTDQYVKSEFTTYIPSGYGEEFDHMLRILDRGRHENHKAAPPSSGWEQIIKDSGLSIKKKSSHLSPTVIKIADVGMRPLFSILAKLLQNVDESAYYQAKQDFVGLFYDLGYPFVLNDHRLLADAGGGYCCFMLDKPQDSYSLKQPFAQLFIVVNYIVAYNFSAFAIDNCRIYHMHICYMLENDFALKSDLL